MSAEQFGIARDELRSFIRRIENLEEEIKGLNGDKSDVYKEAKARGFDVKIMRKCVAARRVDADERSEQDAIYDLYMSVLDGSAETGTPVATRAPAHEAEPHDPETGEILESVQSHEAAVVSAPAGSASDEMSAGEAASVGLPTNSEPDQTSKSTAARNGARKTGVTAGETASIQAGPQIPAVPGGEPSIPSPDADGAKMDSVSALPGQPDDESVFHIVQSGQAANNSEPVKRGHFLRPLCRYPGEDRCGGYGSVTCHACLRAAREDEVAA